MKAPAFLVFVFALLATPTLSQERENERSASFGIGGDRFLAGGSVEHSGPDEIDDLFMAGETLRVTAPVAGTAHLAGRRLRIDGAIGGGIYAAGFDIALDGAVTGDATLAGYSMDVGAPIGGDLRAAGSEVTVGGDVAGYALLTGEHVTLDAALAGEAVIAAREVNFGDNATVAGTLTVYVPDPDAFRVPQRVATADRVTVREIEAFERGRYMRDMHGDFGISARGVVGGLLIGTLVIALTAAVAIAIAPGQVQAWRSLALDRPGRAILSGFLVTSALAGSAIVLSLTLIGILLTPFIFVLTWLTLYAGYTLGAYVLGAGIWRAFGREMPQALPGKFGIAMLGAFVALLAWFVPLLGWLFAVGLTLMGVGALMAFIIPRNPLLHAEPPAGAM